jgi:hypothetical protein
MTSTPYVIRLTPCHTAPLARKYIATGSQTKPAPIAGRRDKKAINTAHRSGAWIPKEPKRQATERALSNSHQDPAFDRRANDISESAKERSRLIGAKWNSHLDPLS